MKKKQIGRNDPCHCGSGKKYKKCCLWKDERIIPPEVLEHFRSELAREDALRSRGIWINHVNPTIWLGRKVWALGNRVYFDRPPSETFHEFIVFALDEALGKEWHDQNMALGNDERHFVATCLRKFHEWMIRDSPHKENHGAVWSDVPDGYTKYLLSLAYDIATLRHVGVLSERLVERLRLRGEFQGARYEVAIAAIFARLGCSIEFLDDKPHGNKRHCEFIARHTETGTEIAVEAKSRHRDGVLHEEGNVDPLKILKGDVHGRVNDALGQNPGTMPFMVFIDLNSPFTTGNNVEVKPWWGNIKKMLHALDISNEEVGQAFNGIFITNYSFHYEKEEFVNGGEYLAIIPPKVQHPSPGPEFMQMLQVALYHYGFVPNINAE